MRPTDLTIRASSPAPVPHQTPGPRLDLILGLEPPVTKAMKRKPPFSPISRSCPDLQRLLELQGFEDDATPEHENGPRRQPNPGNVKPDGLHRSRRQRVISPISIDLGRNGISDDSSGGRCGQSPHVMLPPTVSTGKMHLKFLPLSPSATLQAPSSRLRNAINGSSPSRASDDLVLAAQPSTPCAHGGWSQSSNGIKMSPSRSPRGPSPRLPSTPSDNVLPMIGSQHCTSPWSQDSPRVIPHMTLCGDARLWPPQIVEATAAVEDGLSAGIAPVPADNSVGGVYFMRDRSHRIVAVWKPQDEEAFAVNNPYPNGQLRKAVDGDAGGGGLGPPSGEHCRGRMKSGICAGDGAVRECIAWMLDRGFAGVTPTAMATFACKSVHEDQRVGSLQMYVHHECSAEDLGPSLFPTEDVHAIAILDIRLLNQDRHVGNILVQKLASGRAGHGRSFSIPADLERSGSSAFGCSDSSLNTCGMGERFTDLEGIVGSATVTHGGLTSLDTCVCDGVDAASTSSTAFCCPLSVDRALGDSVHLLSGAMVMEHSVIPPSRFGVLLRSQNASETGLRLVPIDHGFCLPHPTAIDETQFAWLNWSQAKTPLSEAFRQYVLGLDVEGELAMLGCALGDALPSPQYLLTLRIGTALLQQGVAAGLSVFDIGKLATRCRPNLPCLLEHAVDEALRRLGMTCGTEPDNLPTEDQISPDVILEDHTRFMRVLRPFLSEIIARVEETRPIEMRRSKSS